MSKVFDRSKVSLILLLAVAFAFSAACSKSANTGNANTSNTGGTKTTTGGGTSGGGGAAASSPMGALRAYYEAVVKRDGSTAKRYLSAGTIKIIEEDAKKAGRSFEQEFLTSVQPAPAGAAPAMPELGNEQINGDTATVEVKEAGATMKMPMVKEGGEWKLALDKMIEDLKKALEESGAPPKKQPEGGDDEHEDGGHEEK